MYKRKTNIDSRKAIEQLRDYMLQIMEVENNYRDSKTGDLYCSIYNKEYGDFFRTRLDPAFSGFVKKNSVKAAANDSPFEYDPSYFSRVKDFLADLKQKTESNKNNAGRVSLVEHNPGNVKQLIEKHDSLVENIHAAFTEYTKRLQKDPTFNPFRYEATDRLLDKTLSRGISKEKMKLLHAASPNDFEAVYDKHKEPTLLELIDTMDAVQSGRNNSSQYANLRNAMADLRDSLENLKGTSKDDPDKIIHRIDKVRDRISKYIAHCDRHPVEQSSHGYASRAKKLYLMGRINTFLDGVTADVKKIKINEYSIEKKNTETFDYTENYFRDKVEKFNSPHIKVKINLPSQGDLLPFDNKGGKELNHFDSLQYFDAVKSEINKKINAVDQRLKKLPKENRTWEEQVMYEGLNAQKKLISHVHGITIRKYLEPNDFIKNIKKVYIAQNIRELAKTPLFDRFRANNADIPSLLDNISKGSHYFETEEIKNFRQVCKDNKGNYDIDYTKIQNMVNFTYELAQKNLVNLEIENSSKKGNMVLA